MIYLFFFVKLEILKQLYRIMHALSFLKVGYLVTFFKKSQIMIFPKKEKRNIPLLLYATAELGEMALAYSRSLLKKKKKHA